MKARKYNLQKRKVTTPVTAIILSKKEIDSLKYYAPIIRMRKTRFGIFTKSEE